MIVQLTPPSSRTMPGLANIPQSILQRLAPDYREFIEANPPPARFLHKMEWSPMFRQLPADAFPDMGSSSPIPVGSQRTIELGHFSIQVMTPEGEKPNQGWPVLIYVHGGGWVFGTAAMDNEALSRLCVGELYYRNFTQMRTWNDAHSSHRGKMCDCFGRV
jgi:acetyl esterase/lipase